MSTCTICHSVLETKGAKICGSVVCMRKRNAEVTRKYLRENRDTINSQRRDRYHRHQQRVLSVHQGRALRALWRDGFLLQHGGVISSPTTQQRVCQLSVIQCLNKKGLAHAIEEGRRWAPLLDEKAFLSHGFTITGTPKPQYIRTLKPAQAGLLRFLYQNTQATQVRISSGSVAVVDNQGVVIKHIGQTRTALNLARIGIVCISSSGVVTLLMDEKEVKSTFKGF